MATLFYVITCILIGIAMVSGMLVFGFVVELIADIDWKKTLMEPVWESKQTK